MAARCSQVSDAHVWLLLNAGIDGGGSVRVPSALCGIVGLRPTVGRTSTKNCPENAFSIMSFGTHTTCVADAMLIYSVIANAGPQSMPTLQHAVSPD